MRPRALLVVRTRSIVEALPLESALTDEGYEVVLLMYPRLPEAVGPFNFAAMFGLGEDDETQGFEAVAWVRVAVGEGVPLLVIGGWKPAERNIARRLQTLYKAEYYRRGSPTYITAKALYMLGLTKNAPPVSP